MESGENEPLLGDDLIQDVAVNRFPIDLFIDHIDVFVKKPSLMCNRGEKQWIHILSDIRGIVKPGEMVAIMGSSGSGKTTLLNSLAGRMRNGKAGTKITHVAQPHNEFNGSFYYDSKSGTNLSFRHVRSQIGYVMQNDCLLPNLTCHETLVYAGMLRLPRNMPKEKKLRQIKRVVLELGLRDCAHTRVGTTGGSGQRLSGGERRRLSIAIQLLTQPSVLFLDEPTSGLDSFTANRLMNTLLSIAHRQKRIVICTIHQPRTEVLNLFDKSLLLSKGKIVYFGSSREMVPYFNRLNFHCPEHVNPADYLLDQISIDPRSEKAYQESKERLKHLVDSFNNSDESLKITEDLKLHKQKKIARPNDKLSQALGQKQKRANWLTTLSVLVRRSYTNLFRNPVVIITRMMQVLSFGIILCLCYLHIDNDQPGVQNMQGFLYECLALLFVGLLNAVAIFPPERDIFYRERDEGTYGTSSFFLSYMISEVPFEALSILLYSILTYAIIGLNLNWQAYWMYVVTLFCLTFSGESLGIILCSLFKSVGLANTLATIILSIGLLASGSFVPVNELPVVVKYLDYTLITTYCTQILCINEFTGETYTCPGDQALPDGSCPYTTGGDVLDSMGIDPDILWPCFGLLLGLTIAYRILAYLILYFKPVKALV